MKLVRFTTEAGPMLGLIDATGIVRQLSDHLGDLTPDALEPEALRSLAMLDQQSLPQVGLFEELCAQTSPIRFLAPVPRPGKIVCVGRNYAEHAREGGAEVPTEPMLFMKASSAVCGPFDAIELPPHSTQLDWEVELAVVIGRRAKRVSERTAVDHVAGYTILNDVSERDWQKNRAGQFTKGKSHDTFAPLGPVLVTADEVPDPQSLRLWTDVDGVRRQDGTTADMVFPVARLIADISAYMTLEPGDVIGTGTPAGVAMGQSPPTYLKAGQTVALGIEGLGEQRHVVQPPE